MLLECFFLDHETFILLIPIKINSLVRIASSWISQWVRRFSMCLHLQQVKYTFVMPFNLKKPVWTNFAVISIINIHNSCNFNIFQYYKICSQVNSYSCKFLWQIYIVSFGLVYYLNRLKHYFKLFIYLINVKWL